MSAADRSMFVWSIYAASVGILLLVDPNFVLRLFDIAETDEVWIRILGGNVVLLSLYYFDAARNGARHLYVASIIGRLFVAGVFVALVIDGEPWQLLIFGGAEIVGAAWTLLALRSDRVVV